MYTNIRAKMHWRCGRNHEWWAALSNIRGGDTWCPRCRPLSAAKLSLDAARRAAAVRGGECLSPRYVNSSEKMRWRCGKGHEWDATFRTVRSGGTWCPRCAGNQAGSLDLANQVARERGGVCLSAQYTDKRVRMEWKCERGHRFWAWLMHVKGGTWCPDCATVPNVASAPGSPTEPSAEGAWAPAAPDAGWPWVCGDLDREAILPEEFGEM